MKFKPLYRFPLIIGLPLIVSCLTLAAGYFPLGMFDFVDLSPEVRALVFNLKITVLVITLVAATLAVMISVYIVRPVEKIMKDMGNLAERREREPVSSQPGDRGTDDELDRLSKLYNQTLIPMEGYLATADLFLQMGEGMVSLKADGKIAFLNEPIERLLGIDRRKYTGKHYENLFPNSGRNFEIHELIEEVQQNGSVRTRDTLVSTPCGRDVYVRATVSHAGRKTESIGVVMLFQDIEELSRLRDQLRRMDVLASIGSTVAGMAHEVRTPLGYIRGLAELIKEDLPKDASQQKYVATIMESIDRLTAMVEDILSLASVKVEASSSHDPTAIVRESIVYVRDLLRSKDVKLIENYPPSQLPIKADRPKLVESFVNILRNACEAAPQGGAISVGIRSSVLPHSTYSENDMVTIDFHNEGSYIPPETRERLFTPFFTTKKKGTGLGLAISKRIVDAHGGAIQIESDPSSGTLFRVLLPTKLASSSTFAAQSAVK